MNDPNGGGIPGLPGGMPGLPGGMFGGAPSQRPMPGMMPSSNEGRGNGGLNVDDLIKKIDAKIAEIEEEEKREKEKEQASKKPVVIPNEVEEAKEEVKPAVVPTIEAPENKTEVPTQKEKDALLDKLLASPSTRKVEEPVKISEEIKEEKPIIHEDKVPEAPKASTISDDEFFDDFFDD